MDARNPRFINLPNKILGLREITFELTNKCNFRCMHCYAFAQPDPIQPDYVSKRKWLDLAQEARELGVTNMQISGGEPVLFKGWREILMHSCRLGFPLVKFYTNASLLTESDISFLAEHQVLVSFSFYSEKEYLHNAITMTKGTLRTLLTNVETMVHAGVRLRGRIVITGINNKPELLEAGKTFLLEMGIEDVRHEKAHAIGRAVETSMAVTEDKTCGNCWRGKLAITSAGIALPCVMLRHIVLGSVFKSTLTSLSHHPDLISHRMSVYVLYAQNSSIP